MKNPNISSSNRVEDVKMEEEEGVKRRSESEKPPEDDCCPICYGNFSKQTVVTGGLGIWRLFDISAIAMVAILSLAGLYSRWVLRRRVRQLAVLPVQPD